MKIQELQDIIKAQDFNPECADGYFLKLIEEVGELAEAIRKKRSGQPNLDNLKGSTAEELYDVLYYTCALANIYDVNLEKTHKLKSQLNSVKYNR